jgi:hypothetical protein
MRGVQAAPTATQCDGQCASERFTDMCYRGVLQENQCASSRNHPRYGLARAIRDKKTMQPHHHDRHRCSQEWSS